MSRISRFSFSLALTGALAACSSPHPGGDEALNNDPPLADLGELLEGAPKSDEIPRIGKADEVFPDRFDELRSLQSEVKSQGRRGVCSIFSTVGLMEHLYIAAGGEEPDFSEQYLQWSVKFELGTFPNSSGSNASYNLQAIRDFGIPAEEAWPYEIEQWDELDDPDCDGEDEQPTRCYTNGEPPEAAVDADKYHLPRRGWLSRWDIKTHLKNQRTGVVAGMTFFYQSWNHRKSPLPTTSEYWNQGYVLYPNADDQEKSEEEDLRAGHSILLIGWDDELKVQVVDAEGNKVVDDDGEPVFEQGFYIFKNSWGQSGFGIDHDLGAGYGYISQRYINEYASLVVSSSPDLGPLPEVCDDGIDNDRNDATDCDDAACLGDDACGGGEVSLYEVAETIEIPDNDIVGITSSMDIADEGVIDRLVVSVDIDHSYIGDLTVALSNGERTVVLHDQSGGSNDDLKTSFFADEFTGSDLAGTWTLSVSDTASADTGTLNGWSMQVVKGSGD